MRLACKHDTQYKIKNIFLQHHKSTMNLPGNQNINPYNFSGMFLSEKLPYLLKPCDRKNLPQRNSWSQNFAHNFPFYNAR